MNRMGSYDHLNETTPPIVVLDMDKLAAAIVAQNYGVHRLLSALVRARRRDNQMRAHADELADGIEKMLNDGLY